MKQRTQSIYEKRTIAELMELRSKKYVRLTYLQGLQTGYLDAKEIEALARQINKIDVEITAKFYQMPLL